MKRKLAQNIVKDSKEVNTRAKTTSASETDVGNKLLTNSELSFENIKELGRRCAEKHTYDRKQLIVCSITELSEQLEPHNDDDLENKPIFVIFQNENNGKVVLCLLKRSSETVCLYKDFQGAPIPENVSSILEKRFGSDIDYKIHVAVGKKPDETNIGILSVKMLETMMSNLKCDEREDFVKNFDNHKSYKFLGWLKNEVVHLKNELFALVKDGYFKTVASDVDQLSTNVEFKTAIKKFVDSIPLVEEVDSFIEYHTLLKEFVDKDENDIDFESTEMKNLVDKIAAAKEKALSKVVGYLKIESCKNENGDPELDIVKKFPAEMKKFTRIFEPLARSEFDAALQETLKEISKKLNLDHNLLKSFFKAKEAEKRDDSHHRPDTRNIDEIERSLPKPQSKDGRLEKGNKTLEQIVSELKVDESETTTGSLKESCRRAKDIYESWEKKDTVAIRRWAILKKGRLSDSEMHEAIAVLDRANELVTGGHRLRDTQILSVLTFLQQKNKGQLSQIHTGEGKTTIVSLIAAIKALQGVKVDIVTSNPVLASDGVKDKKLFYDLLDLSASTNNLDEKYKGGDRECYKSDIVYGSIGNFQFDYLKDSFLNLNTRGGRPFECIILDEVDSMIIDNATHIAKLSEPLPGMDSLKYVYIKIWQELHKAEGKVVKEFQNELKSKAEELKTSLDSLGEEKVQDLYERFTTELEDSLFDRIKNHIKSTDPVNIDIIPSHIREYATNSLDRWINSAIDAKYKYQEDEQYVIREKNGENVIQPVDYANTGISLKNTIWQYGLHQFLQLKHNLHLTAESLTSCFISNLGYINKYGGNIFGLTGTLGSEAEQKLLSSVYNVGYAKIPTYRAKNFLEIDGKVVDDEMFCDTIADETIALIGKGRSSLIICETIKLAKNIKKTLETKSEGVFVKTFFDEENAGITETEIDPGQVVIATNIAGRGTDFKTTTSLEDSGGLHVCVAFLPCNKRVEDQAFGRTARQGNNGTAGLIVQKSEIQKLDVYSWDFKAIKEARDWKEMGRIEMIERIKIPELKFQDELFEMFSSLFRKLGEKDVGKGEHKYVLDDLKEYWAFWLEKNNFKGAEVVGKDVKTEFGHFTREASKTIEGEIVFNPFYSIQQAEYFISSNEKLDEAEKSLEHAIAISKNPEILHSAYLKLFEIAIERGQVFVDKCRKAVGDVFLIKAAEPDRKYKENAAKYLRLAQKAFKKELDHIEKMFGNEDFSSIVKNDETTKKENLFLKHIASKQQILHFNIHQADSLVEQIEKHEAGLSIGARVPDYLANMKPKDDKERQFKDAITVSELSELAALGTNTVYALREVHDVCPKIARAAQIQIGVGIALYATGILFPPALPVTSAIGGTVITEGLTDIAIELINRNSDGKFDKEAYIKSKMISYGISLLTMGINAALQCPKILDKAKKACRWLSDTLRKCPIFKGACEFVATKIDKLGDWFAKMETIAKFNQLSKAEKLKYVEDLEKSAEGFKELQNLGSELSQIQELRELEKLGQLRELTHLEMCVSTVMQSAVSIASNVTQKVVMNQLMSKVVTPALSSMTSGLKPMIKEHVDKSVRENVDKVKWQRASATEIKNKIKEVRDSIDVETIKTIFREAILGISKYCSNWQMQLGALVVDQCVSWNEVYNYAKDLCLKINAKLESTVVAVEKDCEELLKQFIDQLSEEMYALVISTTVKTASDVYSVGSSAFRNYRATKREEAKCMSINKEFEDGGQAGLEQAAASADAEKITIHIYDENGNLKVALGEQYSGDPVKVTYFPPDENNPKGHYVPFGKGKNFTSGDAGKNNCFFDSVGSQIKKDPATLRNNVTQQIKSDPRRYIASNVREYLPHSNIDGIRMAGGATRFKVCDNGKRYTDTLNMGIEEAVTTHYSDATSDFSELLIASAKLKLENPDAKFSVKEAASVQIGKGKRTPNASATDDFNDKTKAVKDFGATDAAHTIGFHVSVELPKIRSTDAEKDVGHVLHTTARTNIMPRSINNNSAFDRGRDKIGFDVYKEFVNNGAKPSDIHRYHKLYVSKLTKHLQTNTSNPVAFDFLRNAARQGVQNASDRLNEEIVFTFSNEG